jgi:hypothetical protein
VIPTASGSASIATNTTHINTIATLECITNASTAPIKKAVTASFSR